MVELNSLQVQQSTNYKSKVGFKKENSDVFENILNNKKDVNVKKVEKDYKNTTANKVKQKPSAKINNPPKKNANNDTEKANQNEKVLEKENLTEKIENILDIDKEQLNEILQSLDFNIEDLLDENNLQIFINAFFQVETPIELLQIPKASDTIVPLNQVINDYKNEISEPLMQGTNTEIEGQVGDGKFTNLEEESDMSNDEKNSQQQENILINRDDFKIEVGSINSTQEVEKVDTVKQITTEQIINQIVDNIKANVKEGLSTVSMQLNPEHLGKLNLLLTSKEGTLTANFIVENQQVKESIEVNLAQLKDSLEKQGIDVDNIEVTVANNGYFDQRESEARQEGNKGKNKRRIIGLDEVKEEELENSSIENELSSQNIDYSV